MWSKTVWVAAVAAAMLMEGADAFMPLRTLPSVSPLAPSECPFLSKQAIRGQHSRQGAIGGAGPPGHGRRLPPRDHSLFPGRTNCAIPDSSAWGAA